MELKPTYPRALMEEPSYEEMRRVAKKLVDLKYGRYALGPVKPGERVLIVAPVHQDQRLLRAIMEELKAQGAGDVEVVSEAEVLKWREIPSFSAERGWEEILLFPANFGYKGFLERSDLPSPIREQEFSLKYALKDYLEGLEREKGKRYDKVLAGQGGWSHFKAIVGGPFKSLWPYSSYEYARLFADFPAEVWSLVEDKIKELMPRVKEVRIRDEEGTDLHFTIDEDEAKLWREESQPSNHLFMYPRPPSFPEANGVIAGTSNHFGFFPHVRVHIRHGVVVRVEGGGRFGELWREYLERYEEEQYPEFPLPGYYYIHEVALATNPKGFRHTKELFDTPIFMTNDSERNRAGVIHWGFGLQALDFIERRRPFRERYERVMKFCKERGLPYCHSAHIHNYFITYEVRLRDDKEWIRLIDKGWLKVFDEPDVREVAKKYGDPAEILGYEWIPAIPGITYEGSYWKDYAPDPIAWIRREMREIIPNYWLAEEERGLSVIPHEHEHPR